ncbi:MAG: SMC-Scp complex subunit ScpB [Candidatus ainarchaeum sp.]|nr:SMC-Scp complex subunit ScpB [Candidatus ainarchaeum sp.]MDD3975556.1 SMC-Scp complex subunit ScpB [Candidatus ainarchaeum sp.]
MDKESADYLKQAIEAILFMSPKGVNIKTIYKALPNISSDLIDISVEELVEEYNKRKTSISILRDNKKIEMVVKPDFHSFNIFATGTILSKSELKTLAYISLNSPIDQSKIIRKRPHEDLKILKDLDLITVEKNGRKNVLRITKKFNLLFKNKK